MSDYEDVEVQEAQTQEIEEEEYHTPRFTDLNIPPEPKPEKIDATNAVLNAQEKIVNGLSDSMSTITLENMQKLAPEDKFIISVNGKDKEFNRKKLTPKQLRELKRTEREFANEYKTIDDPELKIDREYQLQAYKANIYLGMTNEEFEECDVEYLQTVLQATELRTQGFRRC